MRIYSHPNGSIAILEKDNDDLGLALAAADIAVARKNKNTPNNGLQSLSLNSNQNRTGYQATKSRLKQTTAFRFVQTKRGWGQMLDPILANMLMGHDQVNGHRRVKAHSEHASSRRRLRRSGDCGTVAKIMGAARYNKRSTHKERTR